MQALTVPEAVSALVTANAADFLQVYRPDNLTKMATTTPRASLELKRREHVGTIRQFCGQNRERTLAVLRLHLVNLNLCCDVRRPLNEQQIEVVVDMIVNDWMLANLTLVDYMIVMRRAISGEYGEMAKALCRGARRGSCRDVSGGVREIQERPDTQPLPQGDGCQACRRRGAQGGAGEIC